jgi:DNA helicase IV
MEWKREIHAVNETELVETSYGDHRQGTLISKLEAKLTGMGVKLNPIPPSKILSKLREFGATSDLAKLLCKLIGLSKALKTEGGNLVLSDESANDQVRQTAALDLLEPIAKAYEQHLTYSAQIDFEDMIAKALYYVTCGYYSPQWRFLMVDEFQDISKGRAMLVKAFKKAVPRASLLCVGDDWQAIYRFSGSDVGLTVDFSSFFGCTEVTHLDKTFRFNQSIADVATKFITKNPNQIDKQVDTHSFVAEPAVSLLWGTDEKSSMDKGEDSSIDKVLEAISTRATVRSSVYLLGRYQHVLPDQGKLKALSVKFPRLDLEARTVHTSKGGEADFVVILNLKAGPSGFPSEKLSHPLVEAHLPKRESFPDAEERRLFYVAITRAKSRVYLICNPYEVSPFAGELMYGGFPVEKEEFGISKSAVLRQTSKCAFCESGTMIPRKKGAETFMGCSNYPACNETDQVCAKCGGLMKRKGLTKKCLSPDCGHSEMLCPRCGGILALRSGAYGPLWGCQNYRGDRSPSCRYTRNA